MKITLAIFLIFCVLFNFQPLSTAFEIISASFLIILGIIFSYYIKNKNKIYKILLVITIFYFILIFILNFSMFILNIFFIGIAIFASSDLIVPIFKGFASPKKNFKKFQKNS
jgi:hypothetical protein